MYENGQGVKKNYTEALRWYQKAADQGNEQAKTNYTILSARMSRPSAPAWAPVAKPDMVGPPIWR